MTVGGYEALEDPYLYRGTDCLKNRLGLRDPERLAAFELEMSLLRSEEPLPFGRLSPAHYRRVHWHLFQDVYRWAGRYRSVRTAKGGNWFCYPENIASSMDALFRRVHQPQLLGTVSEDVFLSELTEFLADLNAIHPFREGNGRTQLAFLDLLALRAGWPLELSRIQPQTFLDAMVESFSGRTAQLRTELAGLRA